MKKTTGFFQTDFNKQLTSFNRKPLPQLATHNDSCETANNMGKNTSHCHSIRVLQNNIQGFKKEKYSIENVIYLVEFMIRIEATKKYELMMVGFCTRQILIKLIC